MEKAFAPTSPFGTHSQRLSLPVPYRLGLIAGLAFAGGLGAATYGPAAIIVAQDFYLNVVTPAYIAMQQSGIGFCR